jgi:hypothetical protein
MACYRAGDWKAALAALQRSVELQEGADAVDGFFGAMALSKLGRPAEARQCYDVAIGWLQGAKTRLTEEKVFAEELRRLQAEATQVLGIPEK